MDRGQFLKILVIAIVIFFIIEMFSWWKGGGQKKLNVYNSTGTASGKIASFEPNIIVALSDRNKEIVQDLLNKNEIEYYSIVERNIKIFLKDKKDVLEIRKKFDTAISTATVVFTSGKFDINGSSQELSLEPISIYIDPYVGNEELDFEVFATIYELDNVKDVRVINLDPIPKDDVIIVNGTMNCSSITVTGYINWKDRYSATEIKKEIEKDFGNVSILISDEVKYEISPFQIEKIKQKLNESGIYFSNFTVRSFITNSTDREKILEVFKSVNKTPSFPQSMIYINITGSIDEMIAKSEKLQKYFENLTAKGNCNVKVFSEYYPAEIEKQVSLDSKNLKESFIAEVPVERIGKMIKNIYIEKMKILDGSKK
jgi:hypothetical protein